MRPKSIHPNLPLHVGTTSARIYDKTFSFSRYNETERRAAIAAATEYGLARQTALKAQKLLATGNANLTKREEVFGRLDLPAEQQPVNHNSTLDQQQSGNPYDKLLADLERKPARLPADKATKQRRLELYARKQAEWNELHANDAAILDREADPEVARMREAAAKFLETVRLNPAATVADIQRAERLAKLANSDDCSPGRYWQEVGVMPPGTPDLFDGGGDATQ